MFGEKNARDQFVHTDEDGITENGECAELDIEDIREALIDDYGTAMQPYPMAMMDVERVRAMSAGEILEEAREAGIL